MSDVLLRHCGDADVAALRRIAERDSAQPLAGPVLAAEVDGTLRVAMSLRTEQIVADPFVPTAELVELLRARADHLRGRGRGALARGRPRRSRRPAGGPATVGRQA